MKGSLRSLSSNRKRFTRRSWLKTPFHYSGRWNWKFPTFARDWGLFITLHPDHAITVPGNPSFQQRSKGPGDAILDSSTTCFHGECFISLFSLLFAKRENFSAFRFVLRLGCQGKINCDVERSQMLKLLLPTRNK